jgi:hypothetical protein
MPITPKNLTKNAITPHKYPKAYVTLWADSVATWDDANYNWDSYTFSANNLAKNAITPKNLSKS